jgi:uncharacterized protein (TIGR00290 family)
MNVRKKALVSWSSGKDSAWTLYRLRQDPRYEIAGLFTTFNERYERVNMHATPLVMLRKQAVAAGLPLREIALPDPCPMEAYSAAMRAFVAECRRDGIECIAFGDLFLEDIRAYREKQMEGTGIEPVFPLWGSDTRALAGEMLDGGLAAYVSSVDLKKVPADFAGRRWTRELLAELPPDCDPCGENGEIHTVVVDGPMFSHAIPARVGEIVRRDGFVYADVVPLEEARL